MAIQTAVAMCVDADVDITSILKENIYEGDAISNEGEMADGDKRKKQVADE